MTFVRWVLMRKVLFGRSPVISGATRRNVVKPEELPQLWKVTVSMLRSVSGRMQTSNGARGTPWKAYRPMRTIVHASDVPAVTTVPRRSRSPVPTYVPSAFLTSACPAAMWSESLPPTWSGSGWPPTARCFFSAFQIQPRSV